MKPFKRRSLLALACLVVLSAGTYKVTQTAREITPADQVGWDERPGVIDPGPDVRSDARPETAPPAAQQPGQAARDEALRTYPRSSVQCPSGMRPSSPDLTYEAPDASRDGQAAGQVTPPPGCVLDDGKTVQFEDPANGFGETGNPGAGGGNTLGGGLMGIYGGGASGPSGSGGSSTSSGMKR